MIQKQVTSTGQTTTQNYILDDVSNIVSIEQGGVNVSVVDGRAPNDIVAIVQGGAPLFPLQDQVSSDAAFTDGSGSVVGREFFEPFGTATSAGTVSLFGFTGQLQINTGLYYYRARFYDSNSGRFLSEDPTGLNGGDANLYRYSGNSPALVTDPSGNGLWSWGSFFSTSDGAALVDTGGHPIAALFGAGVGYGAGVLALSVAGTAGILPFMAAGFASGLVGEAVTECITGEWNTSKVETAGAIGGLLGPLGKADQWLGESFGENFGSLFQPVVDFDGSAMGGWLLDKIFPAPGEH